MNVHRWRIDQRDSLVLADQHGCPWTPEDIAYALDHTRTATTVARHLGRSVAAVANIRAKHKES